MCIISPALCGDILVAVIVMVMMVMVFLLDLRWNRLGVLGGRKLLSALKGNSSLVLLRVEGNSISSDITEAISKLVTILALYLKLMHMKKKIKLKTEKFNSGL